MWDRRMVEKVDECAGSYVVPENFDWAFVGVYESDDDGNRRGLWDELASLINIWELSWCIFFFLLGGVQHTSISV